MDSSSNPKTNDDNTEGQEAEFKTPTSEKSKGKRKEVPEGNDASDKKKLATRSLVWKHFTKLEDDKRCTCHHCKRTFACASKNGTTNMKRHLDICKHYQAWDGRQTQTRIDEEGKLKDGILTVGVFRDASNEMLVLGELPLAFIESMAWKHFCKKCFLPSPHSRTTATRDIVEMYVARKASLKNWISANKRRVSLTTDIWVAKATSASYMVITVHFVDADWRLRKLIIGFKFITYHKRNTISRVLLESLAEWGIEKLFTITVDNATTNSSGLRKFQEEFKSLRNDSFVLGGCYLHMRCCAHIINLIVKEGLTELGDSVSAIRNGVQYVRSSGQRCESFEQKVVSGKMTRGSLPMDIKTRWNSTYLMLTQAMKFKLAFQKMEDEDKLYNDYFMEIENGKQRLGPPRYSDWRAVERLVKFLGLFYTATLVVSASTNVCSYKCYGEIATIEKNLMSLSIGYDKELALMATDMRQKFSKYWDEIKNINKMVIIATVFDPRKKMKFAKMCFDKLYGFDSDNAKQMYFDVYNVMKEMFNEYNVLYKGSSTQSSQSNPSSSGTAAQERSIFDTVSSDVADGVNEFERMDYEYDEMENGVDDAKDELDIYLRDATENPKVMLGTEWDVLSWWRLNSHKFPVLSEMAKDLFAMQVSSVASESAFSTSGRILEPHRSSLTHYMVEVLMCTEQWMKEDIKNGGKTCLTNAQILFDIELLDKLEKEFQAVNLD